MWFHYLSFRDASEQCPGKQIVVLTHFWGMLSLGFYLLKNTASVYLVRGLLFWTLSTAQRFGGAYFVLNNSFSNIFKWIIEYLTSSVLSTRFTVILVLHIFNIYSYCILCTQVALPLVYLCNTCTTGDLGTQKGSLILTNHGGAGNQTPVLEDIRLSS